MKDKLFLMVIFLIAFSFSCKKDPEPENKTYPTDGLVSYFNFDDNLADQLGNTPNGTNHGSATFTEGKAGKAINLNGENQFIEFERQKYTGNNTISVSVWFKKSSAAGIGKYFVICDDFGVAAYNSEAGLAISLPSTNSAKAPVSEDTWIHLVGTYNGTDIKTYINGELKATVNHPGVIAEWDDNLKLGYFYHEYWGGSIDDLFIYDRVLSQSEVTRLYKFH